MKLSQNLLQGFAPVARADAKLLILGSMPGMASLNADQYYAFPRNAFWKIMGELYGASPELSYESRLRILTTNHIALWDVIHSCHRPGSLDSAIAADGMITNDFNDFFKQHPQIRQICFNGQKAASLFKKRAMPSLESPSPEGAIEYITLPSTSPAHASISYADKLIAWSVIKGK